MNFNNELDPEEAHIYSILIGLGAGTLVAGLVAITYLLCLLCL